jgi:predicted DNA-binding protein with PD1-like motif
VAGYLQKEQVMQSMSSATCSFYFLKLSPDEDVRQSLSSCCVSNSITAGSILSSVGSLKKVKLRKANSDSFYNVDSPHEILTLSGLISIDGIHVHVSVADNEARVFGGHLSDGNIVFTTVELVIASFPSIQFAREFDPATGFKELSIQSSAKIST